MSLQESDVLSLGVSSHRSWWKDNGPRCDSDDLLTSGWQKQENPELTTVVSCWLQYQYIEILHCIVQIVIAVSQTQPERLNLDQKLVAIQHLRISTSDFFCTH